MWIELLPRKSKVRASKDWFRTCARVSESGGSSCSSWENKEKHWLDFYTMFEGGRSLELSPLKRKTWLQEFWLSDSDDSSRISSILMILMGEDRAPYSGEFWTELLR